MRIIVTGGTGFIGSHLVKLLSDRGDTVVVLTRNAARAQGKLPKGVEATQWTPKTPGPWQSVFDGADAVIHLAGKGVMDDRWTDAVKREIVDSRVRTTQLIVEGIQQAKHKPSVFLSGSAVGYYGNTTQPSPESASPGQGFLAEVCKAWEAAAEGLDAATRVVKMRIGVVLGDGGALPQIALSFKFFVGGHPGSGKQYMPWIHWRDICDMIIFALDNPQASGPMNLVAPNPVTMKTFTRAVGKAMGKPSWAPAPKFMLRIALGERADAILEGQHAIPNKAQEWGYAFTYPHLDDALKDLLV